VISGARLVQRHRIRLPSKTEWQSFGAGLVKISYLIIDDFYDDPHVVRDAALHAEYENRIDGAYYPGDNSIGYFELEGLNEVVSNLVHEPVMGTPHTAHCRFRMAKGGAESRATLRIHVDGANYWSGIVYLNLPEQCRGGTEFYRHKKLGSDHAPLYDKDVAQFGYESCATYTQDLTRRDSNDPANWEYVFTVPMRFNRCVLFRPWFWHTPSESFGDSKEDARLIQMFFFTLDKSKLHGAGPAS
jgi:hypothetical protein